MAIQVKRHNEKLIIDEIFKFLLIFFLAFLTSLIIDFIFLKVQIGFLASKYIKLSLSISGAFQILIMPLILFFIFSFYSNKLHLKINKPKLLAIILEFIFIPFWFQTILVWSWFTKMEPKIEFAINKNFLQHMLLLYIFLVIPLCALDTFFRKR